MVSIHIDRQENDTKLRLHVKMLLVERTRTYNRGLRGASRRMYANHREGQAQALILTLTATVHLLTGLGRALCNAASVYSIQYPNLGRASTATAQTMPAPPEGDEQDYMLAAAWRGRILCHSPPCPLRYALG